MTKNKNKSLVASPSPVHLPVPVVSTPSPSAMAANAPPFFPAVQPQSLPAPSGHVGHVAVRLPEFWLADPEFWFLQADAVFDTSSVTRSLTKYNHCLARMPAEVAATLRELARRVAAGLVPDPYLEMKAKLMGSFQKSPWQLAFELLDAPDLGDRRPSVMMDSMLALLPPGEVPSLMFLAMFLRRLPADMRDQLAAQNLREPAAMAAAANLIFDARPQGFSGVSAVSSAQRGRSSSPRDGRPRRPGQNRSGRRQQTPGAGGSGLCRLHEQWGSKAHKCEAPCSWAGNAPAAGRN